MNEELIKINIKTINIIVNYLDNSNCPHNNVKQLISLIQNDIKTNNQKENIK